MNVKTPHRSRTTLAALLICVCAACSEQEVTPAVAHRDAAPVAGPSDAAAKRPNILLIVADDLGYSDIGAFGGEIATPTLNALAAEGLQLTNFHAGTTCSPTRAMLLSGTDNHLAGLGTMNGMESPEQKGRPGYETYLNFNIVTFVRLLRDAGYHTYMAGKWQLGYTEAVYPPQRGFEESFWLMHGGASHFADGAGIVNTVPRARYFEGTQPIERLPEDFYSSIAYTDKIIEYIDRHHGDGMPFFVYAAYTAPHWPLHAPPAYIDKYQGAYDTGYDVIRERRIAKMRELGLIKPGVVPAPQHPQWPSWDELTDEQKKREARRMEIYAAMVDLLDEQLGRLLSHLEAIGERDNTFIFFISDNGAEGNNPADLAKNREWIPATFDNSFDNIGASGSYESVGPGWAHVSSTPFHLYKSFPTQGGMVVPAIVNFPKHIARGGRSSAFASVLDLAPTFLELADTRHPGSRYEGREVRSLKGDSMMPLLMGRSDRVHPEDYVMGWELFNRRAVRQGNWKILWINEPWGRHRWALYELVTDPGETTDLSAQHAAKLVEMKALWDQYAADNGVIVFDALKMRYSNAPSHYQ